MIGDIESRYDWSWSYLLNYVQKGSRHLFLTNIYETPRNQWFMTCVLWQDIRLENDFSLYLEIHCVAPHSKRWRILTVFFGLILHDTTLWKMSYGNSEKWNQDTYIVTLNILKSRSARRTESPNEPAFGLKCVHTTSNTLPEMTRQSNRLKDDSKYILIPSAHIRRNISNKNKLRNANSAISKHLSIE